MCNTLIFHNFCRKKKSIEAKSTNIKMQNPFMQLRKIVNHPHLVKWEIDVETGGL